jgi:hypothetical protein
MEVRMAYSISAIMALLGYLPAGYSRVSVKSGNV